MSEISLVARASELIEELSPGERALATFMLENVEELMFLSAVEVAEAVGTSNASVTRLAQRLGYRGYVELQLTLREELRNAYAPAVLSPANGLFAEYWQAEERSLRKMMQLSEESLQAVSSLLAASPQIWVGGAQTVRPIASYCEYYLNLFRSDVRLLVEDLRTRPDGLLDVKPGDVATLFTVRRYSIATSLLGKELVNRGATLVVITDDGAPRLARHGTHVLRVGTPKTSGPPSLTMIVSLVQILGILVAAELGNARTEAAEEFVKKFQAYEY